MAKDRLCVALDVPDVSSALLVIEQTNQYVGWYKVGLELIAGQNGERVIGWIKQAKAKVFYDIKLHDIPTTVARSVRAAKRLGVDMINVHAMAGLEAMQAAVEAAGDELTVAAVTVLTSMDFNSLHQIRSDVHGYYTEEDGVGSLVCDLARLANKAGVPGLICSPKDLPYLKSGELFNKFTKVTPGIRPAWAGADDQKRIMTPAEAMAVGSDIIVVGRPITAAADREDAARQVFAEINSSLLDKAVAA